MNTVVKTRHQSEGIAAQVGLKLMGDEDKPHYMIDEFTPSNKTLFKQSLQPMLPFQCANVTQYFDNNQINGSTLSCKLNKQCDFMGKAFIIIHWPAIKTVDRDVGYIWTNARAFAIVKKLAFKMGAASLYTTDGYLMSLIATLTGFDREFAEELGLYHNLKDLKEASLRDMITVTPALGFANQEHINNSVPICGMGFNALSLDFTPATIYDLLVPLGSNKMTLANVYTLNTNIPIDSNCLGLEIATDLTYQSGRLDYIETSIGYNISSVQSLNIYFGHR
ncbi:MAG: hypothetical protein EOP45_21830 [Sphingobacteriaceae bacterium]|nr:MAG: hypothetical protein EOP45_21830 [Sphingobacteriaceae bacterium]